MTAVQRRPYEVSRHRSAPRFRLPRPEGRAAAILVPAVSLAPVLMVTAAVQAVSPAAQQLPTGAARFDFAGAWLATEPGALAGHASWIAEPTYGRLQLGWMLRLLQAGQSQPVLAAAHGLMLVLAVLQVALLWWALRRWGAGGIAAAAGAAFAGVAPVAVTAHTVVSASSIAVVWLLAAVVVLLGPGGRVALTVGGALAAVAMASAPVVVVAIVPLAALFALRIRRTGQAVRLLPPVVLGFVGAAVVLVATAVLLSAETATSASRALGTLTAAQGGTTSAGLSAFAEWLRVDPLSLLMAAVAVAIVAVGPRARGAVVVTIVLAAAAVWPQGADPAGALLLVLPAAGAVVARSVEAGVAGLGHPRFVRSVIGAGWLSGVAAVTVVGLVVAVLGIAARSPGGVQPIVSVQRWIATSVPAGQRVVVGLGIWPDLQNASNGRTVGWYAAGSDPGAVPSSIAWARVDYIVSDAALTAGATGEAGTMLARSLQVARFGTGSGALSVLAVKASTPSGMTAPTTAAGRAAAKQRQADGSQLAENPRISVDGADRARLLAGEVDSRIAIVLAQFVTEHRIAASFGLASGVDSGVRTTVTISSIDGRRIPADGMKTGVLLRFLSALQDDFATRSIDATDSGVIAEFAPSTSG